MTTCLWQLDHVRAVGIFFFGPLSIVSCNSRGAFSQVASCQLHTCIGSWSLEHFLASKNENCLYFQERAVSIIQVERPKLIPTHKVFLTCSLLCVKLNDWLSCMNLSTRIWTTHTNLNGTSQFKNIIISRARSLEGECARLESSVISPRMQVLSVLVGHL